jgi:hypothetical protein
LKYSIKVCITVEADTKNAALAKAAALMVKWSLEHDERARARLRAEFDFMYSSVDGDGILGEMAIGDANAEGPHRG